MGKFDLSGASDCPEPDVSVPCESDCYIGSTRCGMCLVRVENKPDGTTCGNGYACVGGTCEFCGTQPDGTSCGSNSLCVEKRCTENPDIQIPYVFDVSYPFRSVPVGSTKNAVILVSSTRPLETFRVSGSTSTLFAFVGGSYPGLGGSCGTSLDGTCSLALAFTPSGAVHADTELQIDYSPPGKGGFHQFIFKVGGTGVAPLAFALTPDLVDLGVVNRSPEPTATFSFVNNGNSDCTIEDARIEGPFVLSGGSFSRAIGVPAKSHYDLTVRAGLPATSVLPPIVGGFLSVQADCAGSYATLSSEVVATVAP